MPQPAEFPPPRLPAPRTARRDWLPRVTLYAAVLGAVLGTIDSLFLAAYDPFGVIFGMPAIAFHQIVVPLLALAAVTGALILEREPLGGMFMLLGAALLSIGGDALYLAPAAALGCFWAQRRQAAARTALGFVLLIPGVVTVYYGLAALLAYASDLAMPGMPAGLNPPASLRQALQPLAFLPVAILGGWLLGERGGRADSH